jgi:glycosyltransferase involved in cell wall biosynthesis
LKERLSEYEVFLVCDFTELTRILDVYRFFKRPPRIILLKRRIRISIDSRLSVTSRQIPLPVMGIENAQSGHVLSAFLWTGLYLLYSFVLCFKVRRQGSDLRLVHAHSILPEGLFALLLARLLRVPLIVTAAGSDVNVLMRKSPLLRAVCRFVTTRADLTIAVSRPLHRLLRQFGVWNSVYLPNSIDQSSIQIVEESARDDSILYVGSMIEPKRPLVLLQAFDMVAKAIPTAMLHMYGEGPLIGVLNREIERRGLIGRVKGLTQVDQQTLNQIRAKIPLFVLPSIMEGLSFALLEAMAAGQAVIASRNESHEAVLRNGDNALLFEIDDSEGLARQIMLAIRDKALRRRISQSARTLLEKEFSNSVVAERLESVYLGTLNKALSTKERHGWSERCGEHLDTCGGSS